VNCRVRSVSFEPRAYCGEVPREFPPPEGAERLGGDPAAGVLEGPEDRTGGEEAAGGALEFGRAAGAL